MPKHESTTNEIINAFKNIFARSSKENQAHVVAVFRKEHLAKEIGMSIPLWSGEPDKVAENLRKAWNLTQDEVDSALPNQFFQSPEEAKHVFMQFMSLQPVIMDANAHQVTLTGLHRAIGLGTIQVTDKEKKLEALDKYADTIRLLELSGMEQGGFDQTIQVFKQEIKNVRGKPEKEEEFASRFNKTVSEASDMIKTVELMMGDSEVQKYKQLFEVHYQQARSIIKNSNDVLEDLNKKKDYAGIRTFIKSAETTHEHIWNHGPANVFTIGEAYRLVVSSARKKYAKGLKAKTRARRA